MLASRHPITESNCCDRQIIGTIPGTVIDESIPIELDIDVRRVFFSYKMSGLIRIDNVNHKITSFTQSDLVNIMYGSN